MVFPGLVERLDEIVVEMFGMAQRHEVAQEARLVHRAWHGIGAFAPAARPAGFANGDLLAWKRRFQFAVNIAHMRHGPVDAGGRVLPIRQQVDQHDIHVRRDFGELQREFPHIGIGHGLEHRRLHAVDIGNQLRRRQVAPQQHLVAHHHARNRIRIFVCQQNAARDFPLIVGARAA